MARLLRVDRSSLRYHLTARGNEQRLTFRDDRDREHFLELLAQWVDRFRLRLHAYVLMPNHYHLLAETTEANLSQAMQWLNVSYTIWFNRRHQRVGHLFQGRFKSVIVESETWALGLSRYIHLNPVRVGDLALDKTARRRQRQGTSQKPSPQLVQQRLRLLRSYRWSSYPMPVTPKRPAGCAAGWCFPLAAAGPSTAPGNTAAMSNKPSAKGMPNGPGKGWWARPCWGAAISLSN